jgi:hypothetical protein
VSGFVDVPFPGLEDIPVVPKRTAGRPRRSIGSGPCPRCKAKITHERGPRGELRWRPHIYRAIGGVPIPCPIGGLEVLE